VGWGKRSPARKVLVVTCFLGLIAADPARSEFSFVTKWGGTGSGNGQFNSPRGVATDAGGNVYVGDGNNSRVQVFTGDGTFLRSMGRYGINGLDPNQFNSVGGVAVDRAGNVFAVDVGNYRVNKFGPDGTALTYFGPADVPNRPGEQAFETNPRAVAVDPAGNVYVTDSYHVHKFDNNGGRLATFGLPAATGANPGEFNNPRAIAASADGSLYVADTSNVRVQKLTTDGAFVAQWNATGTGDGQFQAPVGVAVSPGGNVYVADDLRRDVQAFTPAGAFVSRSDAAPGADPDAFRPFHLAFDPSENLFLTDVQVNVGNRVLKVRDQAPGPAPLPPPVAGEVVNVAVERGTVLIKFPPGQAPRRQRGLVPAGNDFVRLTDAAQIPVGAVVDTSRGQVGMTSAGPGGRVDKGSFYSGQFTVRQPGNGRFTDLVLSQPLRCQPNRRRIGAAGGRRVRSRRLWGNGRGRFRTRGRNSTATVRGTIWLTKDTCKATTTVVREGTVVVRDLAKRRNVRVRAGQRYVARARTRRR
jgi:hypothetical protein